MAAKSVDPPATLRMSFKLKSSTKPKKNISYAPTIPIIVGREKFAARAFCRLRYQALVEETVLLSKYYEPYTKDTNYKD